MDFHRVVGQTCRITEKVDAMVGSETKDAVGNALVGVTLPILAAAQDLKGVIGPSRG